MPNWDTAFALTEGREIINPRPTQMASLFRLLQPHTIGFITYSEGCNDDVNKVVWSGLGWNPEADVDRNSARVQPLLHRLDAMRTPLRRACLGWSKTGWGRSPTNRGIDATLQQFQSLERDASPQELLNWRFQQGLYRAYYDAYVRSRFIYETALEDQALNRLREAPRTGALVAMQEAEAVLDKAGRSGSRRIGARACSSLPKRFTKASACNSALGSIKPLPSAAAPISTPWIFRLTAGCG